MQSQVLSNKSILIQRGLFSSHSSFSYGFALNHTREGGRDYFRFFVEHSRISGNFTFHVCDQQEKGWGFQGKLLRIEHMPCGKEARSMNLIEKAEKIASIHQFRATALDSTELSSNHEFPHVPTPNEANPSMPQVVGTEKPGKTTKGGFRWVFDCW